jgi:hypothetical protein
MDAFFLRGKIDSFRTYNSWCGSVYVICLLLVAWNVNANVCPGLYFCRNFNIVHPVQTHNSAVELSECFQRIISKMSGCSTMRFLDSLWGFPLRLLTACNYVRREDSRLLGCDAAWRSPTAVLISLGLEYLPIKDEAYLFYIRTQCVPRCKNSPLRL